MANPVDDSRYQLARMMRAQRQGGASLPSPGPARSQSAVKLGRTAANMSTTLPLLRDQISAIAAGEAAPPKSVVGKILTNPLAKTVLKGAEVLSLPGRAVQSTIGEVVDALDNDPKTRASIADWGTRMKDPTTGFGTSARINTGSKWLDRAIGFVGDVALDPITYATFGAGKFVGYSGRLKLAAEVLKNTGDEALSAAVARVGRTALRNQPEVLERVGANKFGVYMFGKRLKVGANGQGIRVPMTGHIGMVGEATLAKIRLGITNTRVGKYMQKVTLPKNMLEARIALAAGAGTAEQLSDYVRFFDMVPQQRAAEAAALTEFQNDVMNFLKQEEIAGGLPAYRASVHRLLEKPELLESATDVERRGYEVWKNWFDGYKTRIQQAFQEIDPAAEIAMRENYFPHVLSDDAMAYVRSETKHGKDLRRVFMEDPFAQPDSFTPRSLVPGRKFFGKVLTDEDMDIESLNRIARDGGFEGEFFETDIVNAAQKYVQDAAKEMGLVERNRILASTNFFKKLEDARITGLEVDEDAVAAARAHVELVANSVEGAGGDFRAALKEMVDSVRAEAALAKTTLVEQEQGVVKLLKYLDDASRGMGAIEESLRSARLRVAALFGDPGAIAPDMLSESFPETLLPVLEQFDSIAGEISAYQRAIDDAAARIGEEGYNANAALDMVDGLEARAAEVYELYADAHDSIRSAMEFSNILQDTWERISDGGRVGGTSEAHKVVGEIRDILGMNPKKSSKVVAAKRGEAMGAEGPLRAFIDSDPEFAKAFDSLAGMAGPAGIKRDNLKRMTVERFTQTIASAVSVDTTIRSLREAGLYAIARDLRLFGADGIPEVMRPYYDELVELLDDAAGLDAYFAVRRNRLGTSTMEQFEAQYGAAYQQGIYWTAQSRELQQLERILALPVFKNIQDEILTEEIANAVLAGRKVFERKTTTLYDLIDSGEEFTIAQATEIVARRRSELDSFLQGEVTGNEFVITTGGAVKGPKTFQDIVEMRREIIEVENAKARVSRRVFEAGLDHDKVKSELSSALLRYQAISDVHVKFEAIAGVLAPHGLVPTEDMWRGIMRTTYREYGQQFNEKYSRLVEAENVMNEFRNAWSKRTQQNLALPEAERASSLAIFEEVYERYMDGPNGPILREVMGPRMSTLLDPITLDRQRRGVDSTARAAADLAREQGDDASFGIKESRYQTAAQKKKWERDFLIPWAKSIDPSLRSDAAGPARKILQDYLKSGQAKGKTSVVSPLSPLADDMSVSRWFGQFFDTSRNVDEYRYLVGGELGARQRVEDGERIIPGLIRQQRESMQDIIRFFDGMNDGFINPHEFFRGNIGDTPSSYAAMMQMHARRLLDTIGVEFDGAGAATIVDARKLLGRSSTRADIAAASAEAEATRAQRVVDAFRNPDLSSQELRNLGFTNEMLEKRNKIIALEAFKQRSAYAKAKSDEDMIEFLRALAGVDLSKMDEGIVLTSVRRPVYAESVSTAANEANAARRARLDADMQKIDEEISVRRREIINKYFGRLELSRMRLTDRQMIAQYINMDVSDPNWSRATKMVAERNRSFRREFLRDMDQLANDVRNSYQSRRAVIQRQIDEIGASSTVSAEALGEAGQDAGQILRYEETPIFATMPDGSVLKFSEAEWNSLYGKPVTATETKSIRAEIKKLESRINGLNSEKSRILNARPSRLYTPGVRARLRQIEVDTASLRGDAQRLILRLETGTKEIQNSALEKVRILMNGHSGLVDDIEGSVTRGQPLRLNPDGLRDLGRYAHEEIQASIQKAKKEQIEAILAAARQADTDAGGGMANYNRALEAIKADPRLSGPVGQTQVAYSAQLGYYVRRQNNPIAASSFAHTQAGAERIAALDAVWRTTNSYKTLSWASQLAREAAGSAYTDVKRSANLLRKASREATAKANFYRSTWDDVEREIRTAVDGMRASELQAARAAGATFGGAEAQQLRAFGASEDEMLQRLLASGMAVEYTLNNRRYVVPSFKEMYENPKRYLKRGYNPQTGRSSGIVGMFYDLRKPGNVAMWKDMPEEVRATAGMYALGRVLGDWEPVAMKAEKELRGQAIKAKREASAVRWEIRSSMARIDELETLMKSWTRDVKTLDRTLKDVRRALEREKVAAQRELSALSGQALRERLDLFDLGEEVKALYGDVDVIPDIDVADFVDSVQSRIEMLRGRQSIFEQVVSSAPDSAAARSLLGSVRADARERWVGVFKDWIDENRSSMRVLANASREGGGDARVWNAWLNAHAAEARFIREQARLGAAQDALSTAEAGTMVDRVVRPFEAGYKKAAKEYLKNAGLRTAGDFNMPSFGVSKESKAILSNMARIDDAATARQIGAMLGKYTSFFKAYATLSPGFHVRNSISNFFQMFAAGAEIKNMNKGLQLYRSMGDAMRNGRTIQQWIDSLPEADRATAKIASDVALALGGGNVDDAFKEFSTLRRNVLTDNPLTRGSRKVGRSVEGSARFMLAYDTAVNGGDMVESFNRTKRFLFDYNDPTILDDTVRHIIPFWTWMSRNLPLQIVNQWQNPKAYVVYNHFARNFGITEEDIVPQYMKEQGAFKIGAGTYLSPDLPFTKLNEQVAEFGQPKRLASYLNPAIRLPIELAGDTKLYNNTEFRGNYVPAGGKYLPMVPLLSALGQIQYNEQGEPMMTEKAQYALTSLIPTFGQAERLFPATDVGDGAAALRYAGIPIRKVDEDAKNRELERRLRALLKLQDEQKRVNQ